MLAKRDVLSFFEEALRRGEVGPAQLGDAQQESVAFAPTSVPLRARILLRWSFPQPAAPGQE